MLVVTLVPKISVCVIRLSLQGDMSTSGLPGQLVKANQMPFKLNFS